MRKTLTSMGIGKKRRITQLDTRGKVWGSATISKRLILTLALSVPMLIVLGFHLNKAILPLEAKQISFFTENSSDGSETFLIARTASQRKRGLMHVHSLDQAFGLVIEYPAPRFAKIWMKDTHLSLKILFLDEFGYVHTIREGIPNSERVIAAERTSKYVVEIPSDRLRTQRISVGTHFRVSETRTRDDTPSKELR